MTHVLLYWNHICVLHNQEKAFLEELKNELRNEEIELEVRYFGLGYPQHMSEYLREEEAKLPDMIVSADLEVFEDFRIYQKYCDSLYPVSQWITLREGNAVDIIRRDKNLLPVLSIPLVYYTNEPSNCKDKNMYEIEGLSFGGINNSAGKTITKAVWSKYGKGVAESVLKKADISDMPIGAFQQVRTGNSNISLVPSIYAMRADAKTKHMCIPKEGPLLIPSYLCVRNTIPETEARKIVEKLLSKKVCEFYENSGNLLVYPDNASGNGWSMEDEYFAVPSDWFDKVSPEEFYELYESCI